MIYNRKIHKQKHKKMISHFLLRSRSVLALCCPRLAINTHYITSALQIFTAIINPNSLQLVWIITWFLVFFSLPCSLYPGTLAEIQMPQTSIDVIKGQMVVLRASYITAQNSDLSANTVLWNFVSNSTQLVRKWRGDHPNSHIWKNIGSIWTVSTAGQ